MDQALPLLRRELERVGRKKKLSAREREHFANVRLAILDLVNQVTWSEALIGTDRRRPCQPTAAHQTRDAAVAELIAADIEYDAALEALKDLNRRVAERGWIEVEHFAIRDASDRLVRAETRRADALAVVRGDAQ